MIIKPKNPRRFFFHFHKQASQKAGKPQVSLHFMNKCHIVDNVVCNVKTEGKINKKQPRFVVRGFAKEISVNDQNVATIN